MPNAKDVTPMTEWWKCIIIGDPGTGKSIFASSAPTPGFVFDFGTQIMSYRGLDFDYNQFDLSPIGWVNFEKSLIQVKKDVAEDKYQTVIVDDTTGMTDLAMERALQLDPKRSESGGPIWNVHYMMVRNLMEGRLRQIFDLKCNVIVICHLAYITDQKTGAILGVEPMLTGQLSIKLPSYFDEVYYTTTKREGGDTKWYIQTVPIGYNHARSRMSGRLRILPDLIPNDWHELMDYVTGKKKKAAKQPSPPAQTAKAEGK